MKALDTIRPELGVLLEPKQLHMALAGNYGFEYLPFYAAAAVRLGHRVVFFTDTAVALNGTVEAYELDSATEELRRGVYELPKVIHNRVLWHHGEEANVFQAVRLTEAHLFNQVTRFDKWEVQRVLNDSPTVKEYLLHASLLASEDQVQNWLRTYNEVYVKPCSGSLGIGVMRLTLQRDDFTGLRRRGTLQVQSTSANDWKIRRLQRVLQNTASRPYLIQEGAKLLRFNNQLVDFRVTVQKGADGCWTTTGIVAKVGAKGTHLTNLARGGTAVHARKVLQPTFGRNDSEIVYDQLAAAGLVIAQRLETLDPAVADIGLDLAVTQEGAVKFIEANGRDLRITFRNAGEHKMWRHTHQNPMGYGHYLLGAGGEKCSESTTGGC